MNRIRVMLLAIPVLFVFFLNTGWSQTGIPVTRIIPQVAAGSFDGGLTRYVTVLEIINANVTAVTVSASFFGETGAAANLTLTTNLPAFPTIVGSLPEVTLDPGKVLVISAGTNFAQVPTTGFLGWARIVTNAPVSYATYFELRLTRNNGILARVGVPASPPNMAKWVIPRVRDVSTGLDVGFALVNTLPQTTSFTATLKDAAGATLATRIYTMPGNSHLAQFAKEFFGLTNEQAGVNYQYIVFDAGTAAQFSAIALAIEGQAQTSIPVDVLR